MDYLSATTTLKQADPVLAAVIDRVGDCTLCHSLQSGDLLMSLCESIIYQQLSGKAAATIHKRFLQLYPEASYPSARDILDTPPEMLRSAGLSGSKVLYLKDVARHVLEGLPTIEELEQMEDEAIVQRLLPIKGIGRWTVQMLLIFRLHRWDVLPVDDLGVRSAIRRLYGLPDLPNKKVVEQYGKPWQPYRTIASWYLWRSLD